MLDTLKLAVMWIVAILVIALMLFVGRYFVLQSNTFFAPKEEALRREVVEQSKAYRDGVVMDLQALRLDYSKASDDIKPALAAAIRHRAVGVDQSTLPPDLQSFLGALP